MSNLNVDSKRAVDKMLKKLQKEDYDKFTKRTTKSTKKIN